jgi:hypothetical protein
MVVLIHMRDMTWMAMAEAPAVPDLRDLVTMDYLGLVRAGVDIE